MLGRVKACTRQCGAEPHRRLHRDWRRGVRLVSVAASPTAMCALTTTHQIDEFVIVVVL